MPLIRWLDEYSINIQEMDEQHKKWVAFINRLYINRLYEARQTGKDEIVILKLLDDVFDYTQTHFTREEELMKQHGYPDYVIHKEIHDSKIREVMDLRQRFDATSQNLTTKVLHLLNDWLVDHIMKADKKYGVYLNGNGVT